MVYDMKVSELRKGHLYLCWFQASTKFYFNIIRYEYAAPNGLREFILIKGFCSDGDGFAERNNGGGYYLGVPNVHKYVTPVGQTFEKYLDLFIGKIND